MAEFTDPVSGSNKPIQGIRALAVLSVLVFHLDPEWLPGGFLGVDVFFVISGLLIARMLSNDIEANGRIRLMNFYARRFKRIGPTALTVVVSSFVLAYFALLPFDMRDFGASMVGAVTLTLNKMIANNIGYFSRLAETQPLLHFWSLMVEIHFYLLIPLLFFVLRHLKIIKVTVLALAILSLLHADSLSSWDLKDSYYLLPSRAWELLAGVYLFLALATSTVSKNVEQVARWLGPIALIGLLGCLWSFSGFVRHPSFLSVVPIVATVALIWSLLAQPSGVVASLLSNRLLVWLGNMSFSLYLWHYPFIVFFKADDGTLSTFEVVQVVVCTMVFSVVTYFTVERSFYKYDHTILKRGRSLMLLGATAVTLLLGILSFTNDGFESSWLARQPDSIRSAYRLTQESRKFNRYDQESECLFRVEAFEGSLRSSIDKCFEKYEKGTLVIGDSHAIGFWRLAKIINNQSAVSQPFVIGVSRGGCKPYKESPGCSYPALEEAAEYLGNRFSRIIYVQAGSSLTDRQGVPRIDYVKRVAEFLEVLSQSVDTVWVGPRKEPGVDQRSFIRSGCDVRQRFDEELTAINDSLNLFLIDYMRSFSTRYIPSTKLSLDSFGSCDRLLWRDDNHWSPSGIDNLAARPVAKQIIFDSIAESRDKLTR